MAAEQVLPHSPFMLAGRAFEVTDLDSTGSRLVIRRSSTKTAAVENFKAPDISAQTMAGRDFKLSAQSGRVILIESPLGLELALANERCSRQALFGCGYAAMVVAARSYAEPALSIFDVVDALPSGVT